MVDHNNNVKILIVHLYILMNIDFDFYMFSLFLDHTYNPLYQSLMNLHLFLLMLYNTFHHDYQMFLKDFHKLYFHSYMSNYIYNLLAKLFYIEDSLLYVLQRKTKINHFISFSCLFLKLPNKRKRIEIIVIWTDWIIKSGHGRINQIENILLLNLRRQNNQLILYFSFIFYLSPTILLPINPSQIILSFLTFSSRFYFQFFSFFIYFFAQIFQKIFSQKNIHRATSIEITSMENLCVEERSYLCLGHLPCLDHIFVSDNEDVSFIFNYFKQTKRKRNDC